MLKALSFSLVWICVLSTNLSRASGPSPSPVPAGEDAEYGFSTVEVGTSTQRQSREAQTTITWPQVPMGGGGEHSPMGGGGGMGSPGFGYFAPVLQQVVRDRQNTSVRSIGIQARDYKIKIPASNGVITETNLRVGAELTQKQMISYFPASVSSQPPVCEAALVYETDAFRTSGAGAILKGYKIGDQVFAYVLGGGEANGGFEKQRDNPVGPPGMGFMAPQAERWIYLGSVAEAGVGIKGKSVTAMVGPTVQLGAASKLMQNTTGLIEDGSGNSTYRGMGLKGRVVGNGVNAQGTVSAGTASTTGKAGFTGENQQIKTDVLNYGCEVMIQVKPSLAVGAVASGQMANTTISGPNGHPMVTDVKGTSGTVGIKGVWLIPSGSKGNRAISGN